MKVKHLGLTIIMVLCGVLVLIAAHITLNRNQFAASATTSASTPPTQTGPTKRAFGLSLQPEAFSMSRRLGSRFSPNKRHQSVLIGKLTISSDRHVVQVTRTPADDGENVEVKIAGLAKLLTWDGARGARAANERVSDSDRLLIERLVLDSPDQFVLAQLRGASYATVGRNVRAEKADENNKVALWNVIRVGEPQRNEATQSASSWRLYYVNTETGLIDRIESELDGDRIVAELSWTDQNGETFPTRITWRRQGQTIMEYSLSNFSHSLQ